MRLPIVAGFQWDEGNAQKCLRHGVSHAEIEALFAGHMLLQPDPWEGETRLRAIGMTEAGRRVFVVFTIRAQDGGHWIRPISARFMHTREWNDRVEETATDVSDG